MLRLYKVSKDNGGHQCRIERNCLKVHSIRCADDIALIAERPEEMNEVFNILSNILDEYHVEINAKNRKKDRQEQHTEKPMFHWGCRRVLLPRFAT